MRTIDVLLHHGERVASLSEAAKLSSDTLDRLVLSARAQLSPDTLVRLVLSAPPKLSSDTLARWVPFGNVWWRSIVAGTSGGTGGKGSELTIAKAHLRFLQPGAGDGIWQHDAVQKHRFRKAKCLRTSALNQTSITETSSKLFSKNQLLLP